MAYAAWLASRGTRVEGAAFVDALRAVLPRETAADLLKALDAAVASVERAEDTPAFAASWHLERGVSGYVNHTVPVAIHAWLANQRDFRRGITDVIRCGGDTDTAAAIAGVIIGAAVGKAGIPVEWLRDLADWPRTVRWMEIVADEAAESMTLGRPGRASRLPVPGIVGRNAVFLVLVLLHGFRRMLPPY